MTLPERTTTLHEVEAPFGAAAFITLNIYLQRHAFRDVLRMKECLDRFGRARRRIRFPFHIERCDELLYAGVCLVQVFRSNAINRNKRLFHLKLNLPLLGSVWAANET